MKSIKQELEEIKLAVENGKHWQGLWTDEEKKKVDKFNKDMNTYYFAILTRVAKLEEEIEKTQQDRNLYSQIFLPLDTLLNSLN